MAFDPVKATPLDPPWRWVGGKRWLRGQIASLLLLRRVNRWVEHFLGGGALYLGLAPGAQAELSDGNLHLVHAWKGLQQDPEKAAAVAMGWAARHREDPEGTWRKAKAEAFQYDRHAEAAGWFLYAQQVAINGLYRTNQKGGLNAALGRDAAGQPHQVVVDIDFIRRVSRAIARVTFEHRVLDRNWFGTLPQYGPADVLIEDPPYLGTFDRYTRHGFGEAEHIELERYCRQQAENGCTVVVCNSVAALDIYQRPFWSHRVVQRKGTMSAGEDRSPVDEVLIWRRPP